MNRKRVSPACLRHPWFLCWLWRPMMERFNAWRYARPGEGVWPTPPMRCLRGGPCDGDDGAAATLLYNDGVAEPVLGRGRNRKALRRAVPAAEIQELFHHILVRQRAAFVLAARD